MNPNQFAVDEKKSMWNMAEIRARAANQLNLVIKGLTLVSS